MRVQITVEQSVWSRLRAAIYAPPEMSDATAMECALASLRQQGQPSDDEPDDGHADQARYESRREACLE